MLTVNIDPLYEFRAELGAIESPKYLDMAKESLSYVPNYFWVAPASSTGKYHPKSSLGIGGLLRHVKSVFAISEELLNHPMFGEDFTSDERDTIRVAILLHDACKQGTDNTGENTVSEHPLLVREHLAPVKLMDLDPGNEVENTWDDICTAIETHMGPWNTNRDNEVIMATPSSSVQIFVHMCDFLASRKIIEVDTTPRESQSGGEDWRKEPITDGQRGYIEKLKGDLLRRRGINISVVPSNKGEASELIATLKETLAQNN